MAIKLEAFPFAKYGLIEGSVKGLALYGIQDEKRGLVYKARIALDRGTIRVGSKDILLTAGLATSAEIKTGKRRMTEYLLSPVMEYAHDALNER